MFVYTFSLALTYLWTAINKKKLDVEIGRDTSRNLLKTFGAGIPFLAVEFCVTKLLYFCVLQSIADYLTELLHSLI